MSDVFIEGIEVFAAGLPDWQSAKTTLQASAAFAPEAQPSPAPSFLPPREKRRISPSAALALGVAERLVTNTNADAVQLPVVFASALGETLVMHRILQALDTEERLVSPTQFHNSVHNSPTGYWMIGMHAMQPATSLAAGDFTASAALLKGAMQAQLENRRVMVVLYDVPMPSPLHEKYPLEQSFAAAFLLSPSRSEGSLAEMNITNHVGVDTPPTSAAGKALLGTNPITALLPLLECLAAHAPAKIQLHNLQLSVSPC